MYDLITIGSINIDMYYQGNSLTQKDGRFTLALGGKYLADHFYSGLGGGAANVAIGVQSHGFKTAVMGKIGENQFKTLIEKHLADHGISSSLCQMEKEFMKISSILLSPNGERTIINYETPHEHIIRTDDDIRNLENSKVVYMANLPRVPLDERKHILSHLSRKKILTVVNFGIADCRRPIEQLEGLMHNVNILIVNAHEYAEMIKKPFESIDFKTDVTNLFPQLKTKILVVTNGKSGSYAYVDGGILYEPASPVSKVVDSTGAGDAFSAGFIAGYLEKTNIVHALHLGNKHGAKIIQKIGAN